MATFTVTEIRDKLFKLYPSFETADPILLEQYDCFIELAISEGCTLNGKVSDIRYCTGLVWLSAYYITESDQSSSSAAGPVIEEKNADQTIKYGFSSNKFNNGKHSANKYGVMYDTLLKSIYFSPLIV